MGKEAEKMPCERQKEMINWFVATEYNQCKLFNKAQYWKDRWCRQDEDGNCDNQDNHRSC